MVGVQINYKKWFGGCKEGQFSGLPFGQVVASMY